MIRERIKKALGIGAFLVSAPALAATPMYGYSEKEAQSFQAELLYLKELDADRSGILQVAQLPTSGRAILEKIVHSIDGIVAISSDLRGCVDKGCTETFPEWPTVNPPAIASLVNGISILDAGLLPGAKQGRRVQVGPTLEAARNGRKTYLKVKHEDVLEDFQFDTPQATSLIKSFGIITAMRMKDIVDKDGSLPMTCDYGIQLCDRYGNGPVVQGGGFLIYAANQCGQCSEMDRAKLFSLGLKVLSGAPGDSPIDPIELSEEFEGMVLPGVFPDSLRKEVRIKQFMHRGIAPLL